MARPYDDNTSSHKTDDWHSVALLLDWTSGLENFSWVQDRALAFALSLMFFFELNISCCLFSSFCSRLLTENGFLWSEG